MRQHRLLRLFTLLTMTGIWLVGSALAAQVDLGRGAQTVGRVNVRQAASSSSPVVAVLEGGQPVTVVAVAAGGESLTIGGVTSSVWYRVRLDDGSAGYIWFGLLEAIATPTATTGPSPTPRPSSTPRPTSMPPADVLSTLAQLGIAPDSGFMDERLDELRIDLSGLDDQLLWEDFGDYQSNFVLRALIEWGPGAASDACGFRFRQGFFDSYYITRIDRQGTLLFNSKLRGTWQDDFFYGNGDLIRTGLDASNEMILVVIEDRFTIYLNGQYAGQFQDDELGNGPSSLLGSSDDSSPLAACTFRDIWQWTLNDVSQPPPTATASLTPTPNPAITAGLALAGLGLEQGSLGAQISDYHIDMASDEDWTRWRNLSGQYTNFVMGTTFRWGGSATNDECGLRFQALDDDNFNTLRLDRMGRLVFRKRTTDGWSRRIHGNDTLIHTGPDASNGLVLVAIDHTFTAYVNGHLAAQIHDDFVDRGQVGLLAATFYGGVGAGCYFDDSWVYVLADDMAQIASPTPTIPPTPSPPILEGLALAGIGPQSGYVGDQASSHFIDLTGKDELVIWESLAGRYTDFVMGTTTRWGLGATEDQCGLRFRGVDGDNYHTIVLNRQGVVFFNPLEDSEWDSFVEGNGAFIDTDPDASNDLLLVAINDTFTVYINGALAGQFYDDRFAAGVVALLAATFDESDEAGCRFGYSWVWVLEDTVAIPPSPTPTLRPSPTPTAEPGIDTALSLAGIAPDSGRLAEQLDHYTIDLSGKDDEIFWEGFDGYYHDFMMRAVIEWGAGAPTDTCGFLFREGLMDSFYLLDINREADLALLGRVRGEWRDGPVYGDGSHIRTGADDRNELLLLVVDDSITVYVNGQFAAQFRDDELSAGPANLAAYASHRSRRAGCTFHDAWIWEITEDVEIPKPPGLAVDEPVRSALAAIGIMPDSGLLAERIDRLVIDLTDYDNYRSREFFDGSYGDFVLGTTFMWGPGDYLDSCGVILRGGELLNYFEILASQNQRLTVTAFDNDRPSAVERFDVPGLRLGEDGLNNLLIVAIGESMVLYLNGDYLTQYDGLDVDDGFLGLMADTRVDSDITYCTFEDSWVLEITDETLELPTPPLDSTPTVAPADV